MESAETQDYYEILGVTRDASHDQIKKAYRKLALKWHPDKNLERRELAEINFKRLAEAYEVLSDSQKRQAYDRYGKEGLSNGGGAASSAGAFGFPGMADIFGSAFNPFGPGGAFSFSFRDPNDVFRDFFGSNDPFGDLIGNVARNGNGGQFGGSNRQSFGGSDPFTDLIGNVTRNCNEGQNFGAGGSDPFGMFDMFGGGGAGMSMHMSTSTMGGGGGANIKRISTSVKNINGKRIETKRVVDNGVETVTVIEDGKIKSQTVNGQPQLTMTQQNSR